MAYLPTQPMFIGGAAKKSISRAPSREAGRGGRDVRLHFIRIWLSPNLSLGDAWVTHFFGTVFVNSWDQKKCPVYIASHMAAHSVFCFEEDERCLLPSSQLFGGVHWPEKWLGYASPPTQRLILFLSAGRPFPTAFPIISQGKTLFFPFRESVQSLDCLH